MASSNRHWPSMFKSKPQWQHENILSSPCHRTPCSSVAGCEERTPETKPRWNPRPEQIRILEAIFNSGMVNPPRDEIRKIRAHLQQYGQVGDANVFYWFQNRKSRSKQKNKQLHKSHPHHSAAATTMTAPTASIINPPPLDKSKEKVIFSVGSTTLIDVSNAPTGSANHLFFQTPNEFLAEPYFFPVATEGLSTAAFTQGFYFPDQATVGSNLLLSELMLMKHEPSKKAKMDDHHEKMKLQEQLSYGVTTAPDSTHSINVVNPPPLCVPSPLNHIQGGVDESGGPTKSTVFINDVCFEVQMGEMFNVREAFGDDAMLIHSSGQPVLTNEWGVTIEPLQHGAFYYLVRAFTPSLADERTIELI